MLSSTACLFVGVDTNARALAEAPIPMPDRTTNRLSGTGYLPSGSLVPITGYEPNVSEGAVRTDSDDLEEQLLEAGVRNFSSPQPSMLALEDWNTLDKPQKVKIAKKELKKIGDWLGKCGCHNQSRRPRNHCWKTRRSLRIFAEIRSSKTKPKGVGGKASRALHPRL